MTATSANHISFIQSLFLTKIVGLDSNSNLIFVVKISTQSNTLCRFGMHFSGGGGLVLDYICNVKYEAFFIVARPFLDTKK